eukprot:534426_1
MLLFVALFNFLIYLITCSDTDDTHKQNRLASQLRDRFFVSDEFYANSYPYESNHRKYSILGLQTTIDDLNINKQWLLDIGSGPGVFIDSFSPQFTNTISIEPNYHYIKSLQLRQHNISNFILIQELYENVIKDPKHYIFDKINNLTEFNGFDLIIMGHVLYYIAPSIHEQIIMDTYNKLLSPNGVFMISALAKDCGLYKIYKEINLGCFTDWIDNIQQYMNKYNIVNYKIFHDDYDIVQGLANVVIEHVTKWSRIDTYCKFTGMDTQNMTKKQEKKFRKKVKKITKRVWPPRKNEYGDVVMQFDGRSSHFVIWKTEDKDNNKYEL